MEGSGVGDLVCVVDKHAALLQRYPSHEHDDSLT